MITDCTHPLIIPYKVVRAVSIGTSPSVFGRTNLLYISDGEPNDSHIIMFLYFEL